MPTNYGAGRIDGMTAEGRPVTSGELEDAAQTITEMMSLNLSRGRCSIAFVRQLAGHWCRMPQQFGGVAFIADVHAVIDQIASLERLAHARPVGTKPPSEFSGPLEGLSHQHWFQAGFIPDNLMLESDKAGEQLIYRRLRTHYGDDRFIDKPMTETDLKLIAHAMVFDALENRAGIAKKGSKARLTGEWIVFAKTKRGNVYLTLGSHSESNAAILKRCKVSLFEFPELKELPVFRQPVGDV